AEASSPAQSEPLKPMDADKAAIYRHPLFPLLALLFEKCEQSTLSSDCITSASFDVDIENFVRCQEKEGNPFFSEDPELDNLMVKAIQVLRIHLLELEKVNELCKDFCSRYIACLKTKMNSETLLSGDLGSPYSPVQGQVPSVSMSGSLSPHGQIVVPASALQQGNVTMTAVNPTQVVAGMSSWHTPAPSGTGSNLQPTHRQEAESLLKAGSWEHDPCLPLPPPSLYAEGGTVYQPVTVVTPQGQVVTQALSPGTIRVQNNQLQLQFHQDPGLFNHDDSSTKNKRGVLPKHATNVMRSWLFQHIGVSHLQPLSIFEHPYPTEDEKKQIATQTNLTLLQVNKLVSVRPRFINARRRILQPMLDASAAETPKAKKKTPPNRPLQRFWPDSIAAGGPHQQVTMPDGERGGFRLTRGSLGRTTGAMLHHHDLIEKHPWCSPRIKPVWVCVCVCVCLSVCLSSGTMVAMIGEGLQSLTSDGATLAVQQVMLGGHSEDESGDSGDEDEDADMAGLGLDNSDSLQ
ncbi:unnamed protein product, partial [Tetraodon nigroviridis]